MGSLITHLKFNVYSAAVSASAALAQRDASPYVASLAIVLALWRSFANALWQFLLEASWHTYRLAFHYVRGPRRKWRQKHNLLNVAADLPVGNERQNKNDNKEQSGVQIRPYRKQSPSRAKFCHHVSMAVLCVLCVLVFGVTAAHPQS
jgi:hypothetical protein